MHIWARWLADLPASLQRLIARTHRISLPRGANATVRVARLRQALCTAQRVHALYYTLPPTCQVALQVLRNSPHGCNAAQLALQFGPLRPLVALRRDPQPCSIAERLVLAGLLLPRPATPQHPVRYILPPELRRWLPTPLVDLSAPPAADNALTAAPVPAAGVAAAVLLLAAAERPLRCAGPTLSAATLRSVGARLEPTPPASATALLHWLVPLLRDLHLLVPADGGKLLAAPAAAAFLRHTPTERTRLLLACWLRSSGPDTWVALPTRARASIDWSALRRRLLAWVAALPAQLAHEPVSGYAALVAAFGPLSRGLGHPAMATLRTPWHSERSAEVWHQALAGPLSWLGLVVWDDAAPPAARCCTATALARTALEPPDPGLTSVATGPRIAWEYGEPGALALPTHALDSDVLALLPFVRWEHTTASATIYRIDAQTLARATAAGYACSALRNLLEQRAGPLPASWQPLLGAPAPVVRIIHAAVALADDAKVLSRAARQRSVRRYLGHQLAPGVALVEPAAVAGLSRALRRAAIAVSVVGEPQASPPTELTASECELALAACSFFRSHGLGGGQALDLLIERLRARLPVTHMPPSPDPGVDSSGESTD